MSILIPVLILLLTAIIAFVVYLKHNRNMVALLSAPSGTPLIVHQEVGGYYRFCGFRGKFVDDLIQKAYIKYYPMDEGLEMFVDIVDNLQGVRSWTQVRVIRPFQATYPIRIVRG